MLKFMFEGPISNNKENTNPPPPGTPLTKNICFEYLLLKWKY